MIAFIKRYRDLLAVGALLALPLITYLANAKQGRALNPFDRAVLFVSSPIQKAVNWVAYGLIDGWNEYLALRKVDAHNMALRLEVGKLREEAARSAEARAENERLRRLVEFGEVAPSPVVIAPVIGVSPRAEEFQVTLGKGTRDGVEVNMAIATPEGVAGRIVRSFGRSSQAILIGDAKLRIPVLLQRSRARATVRGIGQKSPCRLENAERTADIEDGDLVVTFGTEGVFPKGLVVGRVRNVDRSVPGLFQKAEVVPAVDVSKLEEVIVLASPQREAPEARSP